MAGLIIGLLLGGMVGVFLTGCICVSKISDLESKAAKMKWQRDKAINAIPPYCSLCKHKTKQDRYTCKQLEESGHCDFVWRGMTDDE